MRDGLSDNASVGSLLRLVRQFIMNVEAGGDLEALTASDPGSTGDDRWDALVAGVVEDLAYRHNRRVPEWTAREPLDSWWFVTSVPKLEPTAFVETPRALANRGVFIRRAALVNV
ncbi:MAG TPA: hypothetical protein VFN21_08515 [Acidimicrobiales bacterium]|nr:hypothetical protein [Acidimicrobiales bacterium]